MLFKGQCYEALSHKATEETKANQEQIYNGDDNPLITIQNTRSKITSGENSENTST